MSDYVDATAMGPADEQKSRPPSSGPRAAPAAPLPTATAMAPPAATARLGLGSDPGPFQGADSSPALNRAPPGLSDPPGGSAPPPPPRCACRLRLLLLLARGPASFRHRGPRSWPVWKSGVGARPPRSSPRMGQKAGLASHSSRSGQRPAPAVRGL